MQSLRQGRCGSAVSGRPLEVHQQQHFLEREPVHGAELAGKALLEARGGAEQVQGGGEAKGLVIGTIWADMFPYASIGIS